MDSFTPFIARSSQKRRELPDLKKRFQQAEWIVVSVATFLRSAR
jgi:hypothetical protein